MNMMTDEKNRNKSRMDKLKKLLNILPKKPGVYIFKDSEGKIIYIGKAKNIHKRVKSYFQNKSSSFLYMKPSNFMSKIETIDYVVTDNETEALILEGNLIKKNKPKFNIDLKDDKSYPFIAVTTEEKFPRVFLTRDRNIKGAEYFGPYTDAGAARKILEYLRRIFQIRDCKKSKPGKNLKVPCLNYHIKLCRAPCSDKISQEEYRRNIELIKFFLTGKDKTIVSRLKNKMEEYSKIKKFEKAAEFKNKINDINKLYSRQKVVFPGEVKWDFISDYKDNDSAVISLFTYREGILSLINNFTINNTRYLDDKEILAGFIEKYYEKINDMPAMIFCPLKMDDADLFSKWLTERKGKKVEIKVPRIGEKKKIMEMVVRNSKLYLEKKKFEKDTGHSEFYKEFIKLKKILGLINIPRRIECFDISNLGDKFPVGSMSVAVDGRLINSDYRYFKIKKVTGQDDCRMIEEVVSRRLMYLEYKRTDVKNSFYLKPDLIIVDGGKSQFNTVNNLMRKMKMPGIDIISIAKKKETIFCSKFPRGIKLDLSNNYMRVLIKLRDEAHRFAVNFHRKLRDKNMTKSLLDGIRGIGEIKKKYIFENIGSIEDLKVKTVKDLENMKGLSHKDAVNIYRSIHSRG